MPYGRLVFVTILIVRALLAAVLHEPDVFVFIKVKVTDRFACYLINICILACLAVSHKPLFLCQFFVAFEKVIQTVLG